MCVIPHLENYVIPILFDESCYDNLVFDHVSMDQKHELPKNIVYRDASYKTDY